MLDMVNDGQEQQRAPHTFQKPAPETAAPHYKQHDHHHRQDKIDPDQFVE
jgi:hypothetical protein